MMGRIINQVKLHASLAGRDYSNPIVGKVCAYNPNTYSCKIEIQSAEPENDQETVISGWIPVGTIWVGNGWGLFCPPSIGDLVEVDFQEGDFEAGHVDWRFFNEEERPVKAESGVFYLIHKSGSHLKFENNGDVSIKSAKDLTATVSGNMTATVEGKTSVVAKGGISLDGGSGDLSGVVTKDCKCSYTGQPHADASKNVTASKG